MPNDRLSEPLSAHVWHTRYRAGGDAGEADIAASWERVALALSQPDAHHRDQWRERYMQLLADFRFLPGGRILAGAGSARRRTLFNCFVTGTLHDALDGIFSALGESMVTLQAGGGIGCDFSPLRPAGARAIQSGHIASGPVSFMQLWESACATLLSTHERDGAMMATLRCDHPDIERFIDAKRQGGTLRHFNLSVLVSDAFMQAVDEDAPWPLVFPLAGHPVPDGGVVCERLWSGGVAPEPCLVAATVGARALWRRIAEAAFDCGDPGVIFIDRVQRSNNLRYRESISACNPCGEVPLPPHGACNLGSLNLTRFVEQPFGAHPRLDLQGIFAAATTATRMLDNVYEVSPFPLRAQASAAHAARRIGIGITGLADALAMLGVRYGTDSSLDIADTVMRTVSHAAYHASIALARERGAFPAYRAAEYLGGDFIQSLPQDIIEGIWRDGIRNSHLTAIAPAGSISVLANNISSGIEPVYAFQLRREVRTAGGGTAVMEGSDYAWRLFRQLHGEHVPLPDALVEAADVDPARQLLLMARLQAHVDQSISKTVNLPAQAGVEQVEALLNDAYRLGLKGCTVFRAGGAVEPALTRCGQRRGPAGV
ncbi:adenosylcobalamin-dependent ribonucleoside-diphosphate reductase [Duganella hordei]|uniref:adenosylcobalamin-dependent ribonucleoside-diphosphate reductase n=1 Tax=Duganella hordei TaxID=2865934 RepID=UPI0030E9002D